MAEKSKKTGPKGVRLHKWLAQGGTQAEWEKANGKAKK